MIEDILVGDITGSDNPRDIIIGMNTELQEVHGIGKPFVREIEAVYPLQLGSVLSFEFDDRRHLHMIVCHCLGRNGWSQSDRYVRFGMDYLWRRDGETRQFSIVKIGTGRIGKRDGADHAAIHTAMATSYLPVHLFLYEAGEAVAADIGLRMPTTLRAYRRWDMTHGEMSLAA